MSPPLLGVGGTAWRSRRMAPSGPGAPTSLASWVTARPPIVLAPARCGTWAMSSPLRRACGTSWRSGRMAPSGPGAAIAAGVWHSLALTEDGTVWAWGTNSLGELGDGTTTDRSSPVQVLNLTNVVAIAAGTFHNLALSEDGTVWAWGRNEFGELGDGT